MTATEVLRRLLDERGVEWETYVEQPTGFEHVKWNFNEHGSADFNLEFGEPWLTMYGVISGPEQAIAATLGSCNCSSNCSDSERTNGACIPVLDSERDGMPYLNPRFVCSECGCQLTESRLGKVWQNYCPNCGRRIEQ